MQALWCSLKTRYQALPWMWTLCWRLWSPLFFRRPLYRRSQFQILHPFHFLHRPLSCSNEHQCPYKNNFKHIIGTNNGLKTNILDRLCHSTPSWHVLNVFQYVFFVCSSPTINYKWRTRLFKITTRDECRWKWIIWQIKQS